MNMPGFTAEFGLSSADRGYQTTGHSHTADGRDTVVMALPIKGGGVSCCCGAPGADQLCSAPMVCNWPCQMSCTCGDGFMTADCFCPGKDGDASKGGRFKLNYLPRSALIRA
jgi:hypothetical protein